MGWIFFLFALDFVQILFYQVVVSANTTRLETTVSAADVVTMETLCRAQLLTVSTAHAPIREPAFSSSTRPLCVWSVREVMEVNANVFMFYDQGPNFDDVSSLFPCDVDSAIQYINLGYGAQTPKIVILQCIFSSFCVIFEF